MNVAVLNLKELIKISIRLIIKVISLIAFFILINKLVHIPDKNYKSVLKTCIDYEMPGGFLQLKYQDNFLQKEKIIAMGYRILDINNNIEAEEVEEVEKEEIDIIEPSSQLPTIPIIATTGGVVVEKNITETSTNTYGSVKIKNQSDYELTEEMLIPNVDLSNKNEVLIFHTHTCESYTPCEEYPYTMTGNYRTTNAKYNMIRIGEELSSLLKAKGFSVVHSLDMHDYPSYSGSYDRSLATVESLLNGKSTELVLDLHRDAVGAGDTYGPTVNINGESVAQLMFVIGTDGGGLEHPNWLNNLKVAIQIQEKANKLYPGLFRPIILRNSRYNQHLSKGACIIEVGATANTLKEGLLSMQCLANVLAEIYVNGNE